MKLSAACLQLSKLFFCLFLCFLNFCLLFFIIIFLIRLTIDENGPRYSKCPKYGLVALSSLIEKGYVGGPSCQSQAGAGTIRLRGQGQALGVELLCEHKCHNWSDRFTHREQCCLISPFVVSCCNMLAGSFKWIHPFTTRLNGCAAIKSRQRCGCAWMERSLQQQWVSFYTHSRGVTVSR